MTKFRLTLSLAVVGILATVAANVPADESIVENHQLTAPADVHVAMLPDEEDEEREHHAEREREEQREHARRVEAERREQLLHAMERKRDELMERAEDLKRKLGQAEEDGVPRLRHELEMTMKAAHDVQKELEKLRRGEPSRHEEPAREHPEAALHAMMRERDELTEVGRNLRRELGELQQAGREEAAREVAERIEGVSREFREVEAGIAELRGDLQRREQPHREGPAREELERRMHHLRVAIENLHAAGLHEQAEQIAHQAEHLAHQPGGPPHEHGENPVQELQRQVHEMRGQMEEMQRALRMLMERERR